MTRWNLGNWDKWQPWWLYKDYLWWGACWCPKRGDSTSENSNQ